MTLAEHLTFSNSLAPGQAERYTTNIACVVIDTAQGSIHKLRVVWGTYGTSSGFRPGAIQQKLMGAVVWDESTSTPNVILAQSVELMTSIRVYQIDPQRDLAPLPLKLYFLTRLPWLEDVAPLSKAFVGTYPTDLKALQASATTDGLSLRFQRERGHDSPIWNKPPFSSPVNIFFAFSDNDWSSSDAKIDSGCLDKL